MTDTSPEFHEALEDAAPAIYAWARLHIHAPLRRKIDPEDILQEVCFRALRRATSYDPGRSPFRAWVFGIAHNVLKESLRTLRTRGESVFGAPGRSTLGGLDAFPDEVTSLSSRIARRENLQVFARGLDELDDEERRLLIYRGLEARSHKEVADALQISIDAVEKRWQRLRKKLQERGLPEGLAVR